MLLYDSPVSGNCYKVRLLAAHLGVPLQRVTVDVIDQSNRPELLGHLNPGLGVPTLVLDDGRPLGESSAIMWHLADGTSYVPDDPYERAQVLQWLFFEQDSHQPAIAGARFWLAYSGTPDRYRDQLPDRWRDGYAALDAMEGHLASHDFLVGGCYTIADIGLYAYTHVAHEGGFDLGRYSAVRAWLDRVRAQAGHIPITA